MRIEIRRWPSPALVISLLALTVAVGGTFAVAASNKDRQVTRKIATKVVKRLAPTLSVAHAGTAGRADTATSATHATSADKAGSADNALMFGGVVPVPAATPITLINGWQPYGAAYDQPAYWKDANGVVHLKGSVAQPVPGSDVIFVLPLGMRPARSTNWPATLDQAHFGTIEIEADGSVRSRTFNPTQAAQAQAFTSMEGVSFRPSDP
jgi:hypothetical protein